MSDKYVRTGCERSVSDVIKAEIVEKGGFASTRKASLYQIVLGGSKDECIIPWQYPSNERVRIESVK